MNDGILLAIEISNPTASETDSCAGVAAARIAGGSAASIETVWLSPSSRHDDGLMPAIERVFARIGAKAGDTTRIGVSIGPGGFTSLRLAVTAAKLIAEVTGAEVVGVPSAHVVARRAATSGRAFAVALASKGDTTWVTRFDASGAAMDSGALMDHLSIEGLGVGVIIADRFFPATMRTQTARLGIEVDVPRFDPGACLECALVAQPSSALTLAPIYPRPPEAVVKWEAMKKARGERREA